MLVLTRKQGQLINIGEDIKIKIVEIGQNFVRLGIEAPREMPVYREELYEKLKQLNKEASQLDIEKLKDFLEIKES